VIRTLVAVCSLSLAACDACERKTQPLAAPTPVAKVEPATEILKAEASAVKEDARRTCAHPIALFDGSISVDAKGYQHGFMRGEEYVEEELGDLDRLVTKATRVHFTLDYPFEKPFTGEVTGKVTLRRIIDAIRAGFVEMYKSADVRDIPGMMNKDVKGPYGNAFHDIGDLVIEGIDLCDGDSLEISIGS
jgi:hypothetical protein